MIVYHLQSVQYNNQQLNHYSALINVKEMLGNDHVSKNTLIISLLYKITLEEMIENIGSG